LHEAEGHDVAMQDRVVAIAQGGDEVGFSHRKLRRGAGGDQPLMSRCRRRQPSR
jgi:hypothetical protein